MKTKIYVICHDDDSEKTAKRYKNCIPIRISNENKLFESQIFEILDTPEKRIEWEDCDWVGIITYSIHKRLSYDFINNHLPTILDQCNNKADIITLFNLHFMKPRVERPVPFFESVSFQMGSSCFLAIYLMLKNQGYTDEQIMDEKITGFFSNWWISKPQWMSKYISFFKKCKEFSENNPIVKKCLTADGYYAGNVPKDCLTKIFGRPIYEMTPFLFERLPCFFFGMEKAKIIQTGINARWDLGD